MTDHLTTKASPAILRHPQTASALPHARGAVCVTVFGDTEAAALETVEPNKGRKP